MKNWDCRADLAVARDVEQRQREGYRAFLEWFENWSRKGALPHAIVAV